MLGIEDEDELTHEPREGRTAWRESFFFDVVDPVSGVGLLLYAGCQAAAGIGWGMLQLADRSQDLYQWYDHGFAIDTPGVGVAQVTLGPTTITTTEPQRRQLVRYESEDCRIDFAFDSQLPICDYPWYRLTRSRHYEQFGTAVAEVALRGAEPFTVRGKSIRDHAWGFRALAPFTRWFWMSFRPVDDGPTWSLCWKETEDGGQTLYGYYIDEAGGMHLPSGLEASLRFSDGQPTGGQMSVEFGPNRSTTLEFELFGLLDVCSRDHTKPGSYYFAFISGECEGHQGHGVFDVYWLPTRDEPGSIVVAPRPL
jgi:hypothetical protein